MTRRTLTQERAKSLFANATAWDFGDHYGRPDLELIREQRYEEWDQMIAKVKADAWDEGAEHAWQLSGEGWNSEYPARSHEEGRGFITANGDKNPYRQEDE